MTGLPLYIAEMPLSTINPVRKTRVLASACPSLGDLGIEACGETCIDGIYQQQSASEQRATFHICCAGAVRFYQNQQKRTLFTGDYHYTSPGQRWHYSNAEEAGRFIWLRLSADHPLARDRSNEIGKLHLDGMESAFSLLYKESLGAARSILIYHSAALLINLISYQFQQQEPAQLSHMWQQVDQEIHQAWTLSGLARIAGIGRERLRQLCMRAYGHAPMQHLIHLRIRRACQLLEEDQLSVADVAQHVGYENVFAFSRAFKRVLGKSPQQWRSKS